jgi:hypothetical protein
MSVFHPSHDENEDEEQVNFNHSTHTSEQYAQAMVQGMISGLVFKFADQIVSETEIIIAKKTTSVLLRRRTYILGDVDIIIAKLGSPIPLREFLPSSGYNIQPHDWDHSKLLHGYFGEMKRTCDDRHARQKIRTFVRFYNKLLKYHDFRRRGFRKKNNDGRRGLSTVHLDDILTNLIEDVSTPLLFCFNGSDCATAWNILLTTIRSECGGDGTVSTIRGHQVIIIFCKSDDLTKWQEIQALEKALLDQRRIAEETLLDQRRIAEEALLIAQRQAAISGEHNRVLEEELCSLKSSLALQEK